MLEAQKKDRWVPKVGSMIFVPRMKGNFKVEVNVCKSASTVLTAFQRTAACMSFGGRSRLISPSYAVVTPGGTVWQDITS